jgi:hypothetical protein
MARIVEPASDNHRTSDVPPSRYGAYGGEDVQRRLSEALQQDDDQADAGGWYDEDDQPLPQRAASTWQGPGNVTIAEGVAAGARDAQSLPPRMTDGVAPQLGAGTSFQPAPPAEARRSQRRMPEVGDFPPIGQHEYNAKKGFDWGPGSVPEKLEPAPKKRLSLFERLTGRGRRDTDSRRGESIPADSRVEPLPLARSHAEEELPNGQRERQTRAQDNHELPVFFGNKRR